MRPANDNQEKLPNNWWPLPVFILALLAVLAVTAFRAYGGETVEVKYRGPVELTPFECEDITRSSFIRRVCYDAANQYMIIRLKRTYYHYCEIDAGTVAALKAAPSMGRHYNANIKGSGLDGPFDCRAWAQAIIGSPQRPRPRP